jgi:hypothetical protein
MKIEVCKVRLSDGSEAWDLRLRQGGSEIRLACESEAVCRRTACEIRDAAMFTLEDVHDWMMLTVAE